MEMLVSFPKKVEVLEKLTVVKKRNAQRST